MHKHVTCRIFIHFNVKKIALLVALLPMLLLASAQNTQSVNQPFTIPGAAAPELNSGYGWLNSNKQYSLKDFAGKIVLLDFWTLGCINCQHIIPDLRKLEEKYPNELVVLGIHSAKFVSEKQTQRIKDAIVKFGIDHPVLNDADYKVWDAYSVESWPTLVVISPDGKIALKTEGENVFTTLDASIEQLRTQYAGQIDTAAFSFAVRDDLSPATVLKFPAKIIAAGGGNLWLTDSGHDRIIKIDNTGKILTVIGNGKKGFSNGGFGNASFNEPQGLALRDNKLYIADAKNNAIRVANLLTKNVTTAAGDGTMGDYYDDEKRNEPVLPNSPWDLVIDGNWLVIADAGNHQILRMNLADNKAYRFAGTGEEGIKDTLLPYASFSQPSGLTKQGNFLYSADPEASAIRKIDLKKGTVKTILGKGLFSFGDKDGNTKNALLQHCTGIAVKGDALYIADTYNGKIKLLNMANDTVSTVLAGLNEPNGILIEGDNLWITDTNNHQIIKYNLVIKSKAPIDVRP